ncbi:hypothetical protein B0H10DRAFT_2235569 [Mycena sp. CBHHK59/15]|nr:hypothetical protein B0H10DRAFT_2235569 [Mycena sp. CBHHK59/15]
MSVLLPVAPPPNVQDGYICCPLPFFPGKAFKNHEFHSAHGARYYYVTPHGAYSTQEDCLGAHRNTTPPVRVTMAELAGQEWWKMCRTFHPKCQERNAAGHTAPQEIFPWTRRQVVGFTAVYMPDASRACSTSNPMATPRSSAPFLFVICKTASIYFDVRYTDTESRRAGAKEVHVLRSFEEAFNETEHEWPVVFLPNLACVEARPKNLAFLVASRPVKHVKFMYSRVDFENRPVIPLSFIITSMASVTSLELQLSQLLSGIPADLVDFLPDVKQLFITQDASWGSKRSPPTDFAKRVDDLVKCINFVPNLRQLMIISTYEPKQGRRGTKRQAGLPSLGSLQSTVASDSDSEHDDLPCSRHEGLLHRAIRTDGEGWTHVSTNVSASPTKKKLPQRDLLEDDWGLSAGSDGDSGSAPLESPFPFAQEDSFAFDEGHPVDPGPRAERESDRPNTQWAKYRRDRHLDELLCLEGRGDHRYQSKCASEAIYQCKDCFTDALLLLSFRAAHNEQIDICAQVWGGDFFTGISLKSLGLRIQLGHGRNGMCPVTLAKRARAAAGTANAGVEGETDTKSSRDDFCIVASNGIHEVGLDFCTCRLAEDHDIQLLRARLYPSTITNPSSAATFDVLRTFHLLSLEAKCSAHHFYNSLARRTNNNGVFQPRNRYNEFWRMTRQWRHLQMLKRTGRAHAADGIAGTKAGECTLLCPACPQPGKNLPGDGSWRLAPREKRFLYALFLTLDANFRMKRKHVSSEADDPSLGDGIAFFCKVAEYMQHLDEHWDKEQEKSTCVAHDAVDEPDRESYGTASSGIGTVDCVRHNMKRPNGIGDLQKGERYINMDYMLWMSLANHDDIVQLFVSYDIVCQWHKNIWRRLAKYGPKIVERGFKRGYVWLIPKFHLPAHIEACNILYSFNLTPLVGQTDGEAPERGWANTNPLTNSTKEMGPGARCDALDDHFNDWNHKKILGLGKYLLERVQKAVANMTTFLLELLEAELGLPDAVVTEWTKEMEDSELDAEKPNPFKVTDEHEGLFAIRGRLATAAAALRAGDTEDDVRGDLHASEMIDMGLHLEEQQRDLVSDAGALKTHATDRQKTALLERSNKLGRKLSEWMKIRESFTPTVAILRAADEKARATAA